jgi:hypothetical protein
MAKCIPFSLRDIKPTTKAIAKFSVPAMSIIKGNGNAGRCFVRMLCSKYRAVKYSPVPKKAADPSKTYLVVPEKKNQLIVKAAKRRKFLSTDA